MKKYMITIGLLLSILAALTGCGGSADIGKDKAAAIALEDAKLTEADVSRLSVSQDTDNGVIVYEVEFTEGNKEYEYDIQAGDGKIIKTLMKIMDSAMVPDNGNKGGNNDTSANGQISLEDAANLALARVPGATAKDLKIERDYDDGKYKYEGDIIYDGKEYDFEIDAVTGDFLEWSEEKR